MHVSNVAHTVVEGAGRKRRTKVARGTSKPWWTQHLQVHSTPQSAVLLSIKNRRLLSHRQRPMHTSGSDPARGRRRKNHNGLGGPHHPHKPGSGLGGTGRKAGGVQVCSLSTSCGAQHSSCEYLKTAHHWFTVARIIIAFRFLCCADMLSVFVVVVEKDLNGSRRTLGVRNSASLSCHTFSAEPFASQIPTAQFYIRNTFFNTALASQN